MLGMIKGKRRRRQRMRWLDSITDSMDMSLSKLPGDTGGQRSWVCCSPSTHRVGHNWATEQQHIYYLTQNIAFSNTKGGGWPSISWAELPWHLPRCSVGYLQVFGKEVKKVRSPPIPPALDKPSGHNLCFHWRFFRRIQTWKAPSFLSYIIFIILIKSINHPVCQAWETAIGLQNFIFQRILFSSTGSWSQSPYS